MVAAIGTGDVEWDGKPQRVMVLDQGFAWNGTTCRSLTEIAFAMTGTRWSGPRFFRLARVGRPSTEAAYGFRPMFASSSSMRLMSS
jgi:hypothetical protein